MQESPKPTAADQRASERQSLEAEVRIVLGEQELRASAENLSAAGVLVTTTTPLRVQLTIDGGGPRAGRVVRLQPLGGGRIGLAVEFDD